MLIRIKLIAIIFLISVFPNTGIASEKNKILVELFTSQGCHSCPPADKILGELIKNDKDIIGLSFHVDYWNYIGWKDIFSDAKFTARQREYNSVFRRSSIYTPQMVVGGKYQAVGSRYLSVKDALNKAKNQKHKLLDVSAIEVGSNIEIYKNQDVPKNIDFTLIGYDHSHTVNIIRGENSGKKLTYSNVVKSLEKLNFGASNNISYPKPKSDSWLIIIQDKKTKEVVHLIG